MIDRGPGPGRVFWCCWGPGPDWGNEKFCQWPGWKIQKNLMSEHTKSADFLSGFSLMHMVYSRTTLFQLTQRQH